MDSTDGVVGDCEAEGVCGDSHILDGIRCESVDETGDSSPHVAVQDEHSGHGSKVVVVCSAVDSQANIMSDSGADSLLQCDLSSSRD